MRYEVSNFSPLSIEMPPVTETIDVPDLANCIYVRHAVWNNPRMNQDIWNAHFKTLFGNQENVIVGNNIVAVKVQDVFVNLYPDREWRPGNFIIEILTDTPAPNERSVVKEKLQEFFQKLERERICPPRIRAAGTPADPINLTDESPIAPAANGVVNVAVGGRKRGRARKTRGRRRLGKKRKAATKRR